MKKIVLVSTFCDSEEKQNVLKETITKVKEMGLDVMVISPVFIPIRQDIIDLCDFFFYTKENPLLKWPVRQYTHWYEKPTSDGKVCCIHRGFADYGWAALYQTKKLSQLALTFDYDIFHHIIYDLEFDDEVVNEFLSDEVNLIHARRNPNHPEEIWETTLHFMTFNRPTMELIEKEITLENYLNGNGVAEGEVLKWRDKFNLKTSSKIIKDRIFYWENFDFFDYSPFSEFKLFLSKNEPMTIWLGYKENHYESILTENLRMVFHGFSEINEIQITINGETRNYQPKEWEIIEFPVSSQNINEMIFTYNGQTVNFTEKYNDIMMNQVYYNYRP
jgi:hypothetical protein